MARSTADIICVQEAADRMGRNPVTIKKSGYAPERFRAISQSRGST